MRRDRGGHPGPKAPRHLSNRPHIGLDRRTGLEHSHLDTAHKGEAGRTLLPSAFCQRRKEYALKRHYAAIKAYNEKQTDADAELPETTLHDHRHHFAVMHLRRGCDHQWLKNQLGHAPQSTLIYIGQAKLTPKAKRESA